MFDEPKEPGAPPDPTASNEAPSSSSSDSPLLPANDAYASSSDPYGAATLPGIPAEAHAEPITGYATPQAVAQIPPKPPPPPPPAEDEEEGGGGGGLGGICATA